MKAGQGAKQLFHEEVQVSKVLYRCGAGGCKPWRVHDDQDRHSSHLSPKSARREEGALQHRADGDRWTRKAEERPDEGLDHHSFDDRPRGGLQRRGTLHHRADGDTLRNIG